MRTLLLLLLCNRTQGTHKSKRKKKKKKRTALAPVVTHNYHALHGQCLYPSS